MANPTDALKQRMNKASQQANAKPAPNPPAGGGSMSGEREHDSRGQGSVDRDVAAGPKSLAEKRQVAEQVIEDAKVRDVEDTREETSGTERHDLVIPSELNIPPTIVQERLRMGQNPSTGEPWTREERMEYDRNVEQSRQDHARAVRESEERMRQEQAEAKTPIQPVSHVPVSQLTEGQRKSMQEAQDSGKGAIAQAAARDNSSPDAIGRRQAEEQMTRHDQQREDVGVDEDIEKEELGEDVEDTEEDTDKDPDQVQAELDQERKSKR